MDLSLAFLQPCLLLCNPLMFSFRQEPASLFPVITSCSRCIPHVQLSLLGLFHLCLSFPSSFNGWA